MWSNFTLSLIFQLLKKLGKETGGNNNTESTIPLPFCSIDNKTFSFTT